MRLSICGLQIDPSIDREEKNAPIQTVVERYTQLKGEYVDEIIHGTESDLEDILSMYPTNVRILGEEYREKTLQEKTFVANVILIFILIKEITGLVLVI